MENALEINTLNDKLKVLKKNLPAGWGQVLAVRTGYKAKTVYATMGSHRARGGKKPNLKIIKEALLLYKETNAENESIINAISNII